MESGSRRSSTWQLRCVNAMLQTSLMLRLTGKMWLHTLQGVDEYTLTLEIYWSLLGHDCALNITPWPELVVHLAPRMRWVCSECACSVLPDHETRCSLGKLEIHHLCLVGR